MELADLIVVNKADGELANAARHAAADYRSALTLLRPKHAHWRAEVLSVSSLQGKGMDEVWQAAERFRAAMEQGGGLGRQRARQAVRWMWTEIERGLLTQVRDDPDLAALLSDLERQVAAGDLSPSRAAGQGLKDLLGSGG